MTATRTGAAPRAVSAAAASGPLATAIQRFAADANSVLERQLCIAGVFLLSQLMFLLPGINVTNQGAVTASCGLLALATGAAFLFRSPHAPPRVVIIIPLIDILAVGLLRAGTGGPGSAFTILLVLPIISLGVEPGRLPLLIGGPVTILAMLLSIPYGPVVAVQDHWARSIFVPLILGLTCLSTNELTRRLRTRVRAVQQLSREQEALLSTAREHASALAASSALLQDSARQLSSVIDAVTEQSIIATDHAGRIEVFNSGAQRMLHIASHDAVGRPIIRFHVPEELGPDPTDEPGAGPFGALVAGVAPGHPQVRDWTYRTMVGTQVRVQLAVTARRDAAGDIDGFLFVATDVTQDREQARMKDEFVSLISHELRTPLSSILGYLELVADDEDNPLTDEQHHYLATIERNANRLLRLVSDLLFTAQVESGRFQLQEQDVDLQALIAASLDTAAPGAAARNVTLRLSATREPVQVWGDPVRLGQAIDNLVSNAVKFTPSGGRVALTLGSIDEPEARALISVSDTGVGIPADELDRLFSRFFRASTATQNAIPGVGLGLTITKAIANAHRGVIRVASTLDEGTTFTLDLPARAVYSDGEG